MPDSEIGEPGRKMRPSGRRRCCPPERPPLSSERNRVDHSLALAPVASDETRGGIVALTLVFKKLAQLGALAKMYYWPWLRRNLLRRPVQCLRADLRV